MKKTLHTILFSLLALLPLLSGCVTLTVEADTFEIDYYLVDDTGTEGNTTNFKIWEGKNLNIQFRGNHEKVRVEKYECISEDGEKEFEDLVGELLKDQYIDASTHRSSRINVIPAKDNTFSKNHCGTMTMVLYDETTDSRKTISKQYEALVPFTCEARFGDKFWDEQSYSATSCVVVKRSGEDGEETQKASDSFTIDIFPSGVAAGAKGTYKEFYVKECSVKVADLGTELDTDIILDKKYTASGNDLKTTFNVYLDKLVFPSDQDAVRINVYLKIYNEDIDETSYFGGDYGDFYITAQRSFVPGTLTVTKGSVSSPAVQNTDIEFSFEPTREMQVTEYSATNITKSKSETNFDINSGTVTGKEEYGLSKSTTLFTGADGKLVFRFTVKSVEEGEAHNGRIDLKLYNPTTKQTYSREVSYRITRNATTGIEATWTVPGKVTAEQKYTEGTTVYFNSGTQVTLNLKFTPSDAQGTYTVSSGNLYRAGLVNESGELVQSVTKDISSSGTNSVTLLMTGTDATYGGGKVAFTVKTSEGSVKRTINIYVRHRLALVMYGSFEGNLIVPCAHQREHTVGWYGVPKNISAKIVRFTQDDDGNIKSVNAIQSTDAVLKEAGLLSSTWSATYKFYAKAATGYKNYNTYGGCGGQQILLLDIDDYCSACPGGKHVGYWSQGQPREEYAVGPLNSPITETQGSTSITVAYNLIYVNNGPRYYNDDVSEGDKTDTREVYSTWTGAGYEVSDIQYDQEKIEIRYILNGFKRTDFGLTNGECWWVRSGNDLMDEYTLNPNRKTY